jgi:hypothetical protein
VGLTLFRMSTWMVLLTLVVLVGGAAALGTVIGRRLRARPDTRHEPAGAVQAALLGLVGLVLAFGLTMAVGRYDNRRAIVVEEANAIGTTYLRAQLLDEPNRTDSLQLLRQYADQAVDLADQVPDSDGFDQAVRHMQSTQRDLWSEAGTAVRRDPDGSVPRLYIESLNQMIDLHSDRVTSVRNRVPSTVVVLQVLGGAVAVGALFLYLALLGRGLLTALVAAAVVILILFISIDLDRPHRGLITVPDKPLADARAAMDEPAASAP